jgi:cobalamin biosynthesis protein CobD/CbiB
MNAFSLTFFVVFLVAAVAAALMISLGRKREYGFVEVWMQGSFIYRRLPKYIKARYITPILVLTYTAILSFLLVVGSLLYAALQKS